MQMQTQTQTQAPPPPQQQQHLQQAPCEAGSAAGQPYPFAAAAAAAAAALASANQRACLAQFASLHSLSAAAAALQKHHYAQHSQQHPGAHYAAGGAPTAPAQLQGSTQLGQPARRPAGRRRQSRKCRKMYGMARRSLWCTQCRWKKACSRFCDRRPLMLA